MNFNTEEFFTYFLLVPIGYSVQRIVSFSSKITKLETKQNIYIQEYDKDVKELKTKVNKLFDETHNINEKLNILIGQISKNTNDIEK